MESTSKGFTLTTERMILRPFTMNDREALLAITQEPGIFQYFPTKSAWGMEKVERSIQHQTNHWQTFRYGQMAVTLRETGQLMGWCGLEFLPDTNAFSRPPRASPSRPLLPGSKPSCAKASMRRISSSPTRRTSRKPRPSGASKGLPGARASR